MMMMMRKKDNHQGINGDKHLQNTPLAHVHLTPVERRVYTALASVPKGKVTTYGALAKAAGIANGQRVVGRIMNKNPYPVIIPCHRVVMSTGDIGGYAHGTAIKANMLESEGVSVCDGKIKHMSSIVHTFD